LENEPNLIGGKMLKPTISQSGLISKIFLERDKPQFLVEAYTDNSGMLLAYISKWHILFHRGNVIRPREFRRFDARTIPIENVTREQMLDIIKTETPDCFEWFLWNPMWLG